MDWRAKRSVEWNAGANNLSVAVLVRGVDVRSACTSYQVLECERQDQLYIHLAPAKRNRVLCPCCGGVRLRSKGSYRRRARHLDCFGTPSVLLIHTRRFACRDCGRTFVPSLPGLLPGRHSTEPFRERVYRHHHEGIPSSSMARLQRIGAATVSRIYAQFTRRKAAERTSLQCPTVLGIDEHTLHKGQRFATTFCDLKNHRVFDIAQGRSGAAILSFLQTLQGRERVRVVCIDLSSPYRALIRRWFPKARIVADRFHVIRVVIHHFMALCRQIAPEIKNNSGSLAVLRKNPHNLTASQKLRLARLLADHPAFVPSTSRCTACALSSTANTNPGAPANHSPVSCLPSSTGSPPVASSL